MNTQAQLKKAYGTELAAINTMIKTYYEIDNIKLYQTGDDLRHKIKVSAYEYIYETLSKRLYEISKNALWNGHTDQQVYNVFKQYEYCQHLDLYYR